MLRFGTAAGLFAGLLLFATLVPAADTTVRTELPLKVARSREPVLGGSKDKVYFSVWIPEGVKTVRGAVCNPFSRDEAVSKHWQAACRNWQFAYVQTDFDAVKKVEFALLSAALTELAKTSGHPELAHVPFCFLGMSRGGGMSMQLGELMPERTIAIAPVCLEVGPESEASRHIPVITIFGEKDGAQMTKLLDKFPLARKQGARWALAPQWNRKHEFGQANNLAFAFFDDVIAKRVSANANPDQPVKLKEISLESGWLGDSSTWSKDGTRPAIAAYADFKGDRQKACWFPSQRVAAVWQAFVGASKSITINEPRALAMVRPLHGIRPPNP